jgi:hypothetical protein
MSFGIFINIIGAVTVFATDGHLLAALCSLDYLLPCFALGTEVVTVPAKI